MDDLESLFGLLVEEMWLSPDKLAHALTCALVTLAAWRALRGTRISPGRTIWLIAFAVLALGLVRELSDWWVGKYFSEKDMLWNGVGVAAGIALIVTRSRPGRPPDPTAAGDRAETSSPGG